MLALRSNLLNCWSLVGDKKQSSKISEWQLVADLRPVAGRASIFLA